MRKAQKPMGIRFSCPQGHQLNVKAELAGKRGVCPHCGAKVQIPDTSLPRRGNAGVGAEVQASAPLVEAAPKAAKPQAAEIAASAAAEEAWFVRPPGGGQFGPASSADFSQWIREDRVVAEAYVWRTGWADWRRADEATAELPAPLPKTTTPDAASPVVPPPARPVVEPAQQMAPSQHQASKAKRLAPRRKRSAQRQLLVAVVLLIVALVLGGILYWVLQQQSGETARLHVATRCLPAGEVLV